MEVYSVSTQAHRPRRTLMQNSCKHIHTFRLAAIHRVSKYLDLNVPSLNRIDYFRKSTQRDRL